MFTENLSVKDSRATIIFKTNQTLNHTIEQLVVKALCNNFLILRPLEYQSYIRYNIYIKNIT